MVDTAFQIQYRQEFIAIFEQGLSLLRNAVTTEVEIKGNQAVFLTAGSGSASAVTRGVNGLIPARADSLTQNTATLTEWHDLVRKTGFNIFASQGNQRAIMQMTTLKVINRKIDFDIIAELDGAVTNHAGSTAQTMSLNLAMRAWTILGVNFVPVQEEDNMFIVITPAAFAYMMQVKEFAHADYVSIKPFDGALGNGATTKYRRFAGMNWIVHPNLTGVGTNSEKCYMFHRSALGHAINSAGIASPVGYMEEQDYSWARASVYVGTKTLQTAGMVQILHDGSGYAAT